MADKADFIRDVYFDRHEWIVSEAGDVIDALESLITEAQRHVDDLYVVRSAYSYESHKGFSAEHRERTHLDCKVHAAKVCVSRAADKIGWAYERIDAISEEIELLASIISKLDKED